MVRVDRLRKSFGKRTILSSVSFEAGKGDSVVILGPNGCGKTTLLQILAGALRADGGEISYFGENPFLSRGVFRRYCGYVPQENPLIDELSVLDNLRLWGYRKKEDPGLLEEFDLSGILSEKVSALSGGMKRRLSIASACIFHPPILLLDEPTAALDLYYRREIMNRLRTYRKQGGIVIMTSHEESEIAEAGQCILLIDGHSCRYMGSDRSMDRILSLTREELEDGKET